MPLRRRAWLTREGWYYSTVLAFIIGGAVLRSINLLVILAGMMIASLLFNWRLVMASLTGLVIHRRVPEQVLAGEPLTVEITVENTRWWMSSWLLTVEDWVERCDDPTRGMPDGSEMHQAASRPFWQKLPGWILLGRIFRWHATHAAAILAHVPARGKALATYRITLHRRGRYRFGPLRASTRFPLALVHAEITLPALAECIVAPRLGKLLPEWATLLDAELVGDQRRHPQRGLSDGDYYGLRSWQSGDSLRWVHWRTTAKLGRPVVRQFERRKNRDVSLLLDPWLPELAGEQDAGWLELAISLAATVVADVTGQGSSRLTLAIAGSHPEYFRGAGSALFCQEILTKLAELSGGSQYALANTLLKTLDAATPGSRLIVISPRPADHPSLTAATTELPLDPSDLVWVDASSQQLQTLFALE